jgi:Uma2 family endonuclease
MNRKEPSNSTPTGARSCQPDSPDPFRFGWRYVRKTRPDGTEESVQVPLTLDDVLHPREGDHIPENTQQERDRRYLADLLTWRLAGIPHAVVLSDCLIDWGIKGLGDHSPDVSVFDGVQNPDRHWSTFRVAVEKARPVLAIEVVSPDAHDRQARDNDVVAKVRHYYRARVPLYLIVDQEKEDGPRQLVLYRRGPRKYLRVPPDVQGHLLLEPVNLLVALRDERVVCFEAETGEEIPGFSAAWQARQAAEAARAAEAQARQAAEAALAAAQARIRELQAQTRRGGKGPTR